MSDHRGEDAHTRSSTDCGPDYCLECSASASDWVGWPCVGSVRATVLDEKARGYWRNVSLATAVQTTLNFLASRAHPGRSDDLARERDEALLNGSMDDGEGMS